MPLRRLGPACLLLAVVLAPAIALAAGARTPDPRAPEVEKILEQAARGDHAGAVKAVDEFLARHGLDADTFGLLFFKAHGQRQLGQIAAAIESYQRMLPFIERLHNVGQRRFVPVYFQLALLHRAQGRHDAAIRFVEAGLTRAPQAVYYQILLGELLAERGDRDRARTHFETLLASATPNPEERLVMRLKLDRLRPATAPAIPPAPARLHGGLSIGIVPLNGQPGSVAVADVCVLLQSKWLVRCAVLPPIEVDEARLLDGRRGQYDADRVLVELGRRYPAHQRPHRTLIAVTSRDIFGHDTNYVFSWQAPRAGLGVLSTYRFAAGLDDFYEPSVVVTRRVGIQFLSTSGSLLGFSRPSRPECPLAYPNDFREFLLKGSKLCGSTVEQRDVLLRREGGPGVPFDAAQLAEMRRVYATYAFD